MDRGVNSDEQNMARLRAMREAYDQRLTETGDCLENVVVLDWAIRTIEYHQQLVSTDCMTQLKIADEFNPSGSTYRDQAR